MHVKVPSLTHGCDKNYREGARVELKVCLCQRLAKTLKVTILDEFLAAAIAEAELGLAEGGIPIGSVLVYRNDVVGRGHNRRVQRGSTILHGEMDALENAGRLPTSVYKNSTLYTTLSPCAMCSGTILLYGIPRVVIAENTNFTGEEALLSQRGVQLDILHNAYCIEMMAAFIKANPTLWFEDIGQ